MTRDSNAPREGREAFSGPRNERPLGVFDSGLGGLTVVRALRARLPHENIVYLGDTARVPYGTKGEATVIRYALACAKHLVSHDIKALIIACNTVSAVAPARVRAELDIPVLGVIEPGAETAVATSISGRIGILATAATIASNAYIRAISALSTRAECTGVAAPLLVPLAEEGWLSGDVPTLAVRRYLEPLARARVDTVVLGCTHYPLLEEVITREARAMIGPDVRIVDSACATAAHVEAFLASRNMTRSADSKAAARTDLLATDVPSSFAIQASRFLGESHAGVTLVDL